MYLSIIIVVTIFVVPIFNYEVSCEIQSTAAYKFGTSAAYYGSTFLMKIIPGLTQQSDLTKLLIGRIATTLIYYFWPMIIGQNRKCLKIAMERTKKLVESTIDIDIGNYSIQRRHSFFDGLQETAFKVYEWVPIVTDSTMKADKKKEAFNAYSNALQYLYIRANNERDQYLDASKPDDIILLKEMALLQLNVLAEMLANPYLNAIERMKFENDLKDDAEFYWRHGHLTVENAVKCLPNDKIMPSRSNLTRVLEPMFSFVGKVKFRNIRYQYSMSNVYQPLLNGENVGFRSDKGSMLSYHEIFNRSTNESKPNCSNRCGWDLWSHVNDCGGQIFRIITQNPIEMLGVPIRVCDVIVLEFYTSWAHSNVNIAEEHLLMPFKITGPKCGSVIPDRSRVMLTSVNNNISNKNDTEQVFDVIVIKV